MGEFDGVPPNAVRLTAQARSIARNLTRAESAVDGRDNRSDADLQAASQQFEALLLHMMVREMRATVPDSPLFPQSMTQELFTGMLDEQIAGEMSRHGGIGLSRLIFDQLNSDRQVIAGEAIKAEGAKGR